MNKKNLPNIPIYIGDWERDCNVLSLESEAAWMRIVFKLWTKGKQNAIKIPTKSLQNLWRCSPEKMQEILNDLIFNEIAEITVNTDFVEFTCRRFVKENAISEIRSKASKGSKSSNKSQTKAKQKPNKNEQNTDNDNDYENDNEYKNEIKTFGKSENLLNHQVDHETFLDIENLKIEIQKEFTWSETIIKNLREVIPKFNENDFKNYLEQFFKQIENDGETSKTIQDTKKHFSRWLNIEIRKNANRNNSNPNGHSANIKETFDAIDSMYGK